MKHASQTRFTTAQALELRSAEPVHIAPGAQPLNGEVSIELRKSLRRPSVIVTDHQREISWRVEMLPMNEAQGWIAALRMPSVPTMINYHFEFAEGDVLYSLRQVESLIPGTSNPTFGEWARQPFQITVYNPAAMPPLWAQGQVLYQIFPDRFARSGETSVRERRAQHVQGHIPLWLRWDDLPENPPLGRDFYGGDLRGIQEKIDGLRSLGVECIYLTPIFESPSNHRYDAMDYYQIDPLLGSEADLAALIQAAHERGMRVVLDIVCNHCSNDSRYFNQSGWYGDDVGAYRSKASPFYRMFMFDQHPDEYEGWVGVKSMPEFVECPEHEAFFLGVDGVLPYWTRLGVDGWRTDVTPWMSLEFWRRMRRSLSSIDPNLLLIAEAWDDASHYLVGDSYHATMNYRFAWAAIGFFALGVLSVTEFVERLDELRRDTPPPALLAQVNLVSSHDTARMLTKAGGDARKVWQMFAFMLAYPGSPMLYYGEEAGLEGAFAEDGRRAFPWGQEDRQTEDFVRRALAVRRASAVLRLGDYTTLYRDDRARTLAFMRRSNNEILIAVFNGGNEAVEIALPVPVDIDASTRWQDALEWNGEAVAHNGILKVRIIPHSAGWYEQVSGMV